MFYLVEMEEKKEEKNSDETLRRVGELLQR